MKIAQIVLIALAAISGCNKKSDVSAATNQTQKIMPVSDTLNYLALGDSYTIGEAVPQTQNFPYQLIGSLNVRSFKVHPPTIIAATGWTTDNLIYAISRSDIHAKKYDIVTLLIGVNDQYQHLSINNYQTKFQAVLSTAISFANNDASRVFVLSIPDWGVTPFANGQESTIGPEIDQFNAVNRSVSQKAGVNYLDITSISRMAATDLSLIAPDGLHPSGKMYSLWIGQLEPMVEFGLKK
jgi:lysophospholipase L1-like esterase